MERCKQYTKEQINDYLQNRFPEEECQAFQLHLIACDSCRMELKRMRNLADFLAEEEQEEALSKRTFSLKRTRTIAAVVGGLFLLASGSYYFFYPRESADFPFETEQPPVYHTGDTLKIETDSLKTDSVTLLPLEKYETDK